MPSTASHCWHLAGRTDVRGFWILRRHWQPHALLAISPTSAFQDLDLQPKLVFIFCRIKIRDWVDLSKCEWIPSAALQCWQGKANVRGFYDANAGSPTYDSLAQQVHLRTLTPACPVRVEGWVDKYWEVVLPGFESGTFHEAGVMTTTPTCLLGYGELWSVM
jgi:hypothetical protein